MGMHILNLVQGSQEWKDIRIKFCVASEAPVIMGASPHISRDELIKLKATGIEREINEWVEKFIFKRGHEVEALARPIAEARLGDELYALTATNEVSGLSLLASFDGITAPLYDDHWEHKQFNAELFALVQSGGELEPKHYWQLEHQLLVNGNDSCRFAVSDGTEKNYAEIVYRSRPERREQLIEGWKLFLADLANYVHRTVEIKPTGASIKDLPALIVEISGEVKSSNLMLYKANALDFISNIKTELVTDQDFADADNVVKFCDRVEKELETVKKLTLSQAVSIDEVVRTIDLLKEEMRKKRLHLNKLIETEKESRKAAIIAEAGLAWREHISSCNDRLGGKYMPIIPADFPGAGKGKRTLETFRSAVNDELARTRIEANRIANLIEANLKLVDLIAENHKFLLADINQLILKDSEALEAIVKQRIAEHDKEQERIAEQKRLAEEKRIADEKAEQERIAEAKRKADELAAQQKSIQALQSAEPVVQELPLVIASASYNEYEEMAAINTPEFNEQFMQVFEEEAPAPADTPAPAQLEPTEFQRGLELSIKIYEKCQRTGQDFVKTVRQFIEADQANSTKAA